MKKQYILFAILLLFGCVLPAQAQLDSTDKGAVPVTPNFFAIRAQKLEQWGGKVPGPGNGYKPFKRWENFWESRVLPDGSFPDPKKNDEAWANYQQAQAKNSKSDFQMPANWTSLGPNSSAGGYFGIGRINCVAFHPSNVNIIWVGSAAGGLWKSTNGGASWSTNTDNLLSATALGVSSIAVDIQNPNVLYMATGDRGKAAGTDYFPYSTGVFKSTDGGTTWNSTGALPSPGNAPLINEVMVHPTNSAIVFAATSAGIYRSDNGGSTWSKRLSGAFVYDLAIKPGSSSMIYAASSDAFFRSTNGGLDWISIGTLPNSGRIQIEVSPQNSDFIALVSSKPNGSFNGFYASENSGGFFKLRYAGPRNLLNSDPFGGPDGGNGQGDYDLCITVSPTNINTLYIGGVNLWKSTDGGYNWVLANYWFDENPPPGVPVVHADKHCLAWQNSNTLFQGNDGGIYKSTNNGTSWTDMSSNLAISQLYRIGVSKSDNKILGGLQDNSTKLRQNNGTWVDILKNGDGVDAFFDPINSNIMYSARTRGALNRSSNGGNSWMPLIVPTNQPRAWITPFAMDPNNSSTLYFGTTAVWKSGNAGQNWEQISPELSVNTDDYLRTLQSLVLAPSNSNIIYAATYNEIWKTTTGGNGPGSWTIITQNLPVNANKISFIAVDPSDPNKVYVTFRGYGNGNKVFRSTNGGGSWTDISGSLPPMPANCVTIQPGGNNALYVGTDVGVFYRDGTMTDWVPFNGGMPTVIVMELECNTSSNKIIAATFGRGLWESSYFNASSSNSLSISPANQNVTKSAGSTTFSISSNTSWTLSDNASWLTVTPTSGTGNMTVNAAYTVNTGANARVVTITVTGANLSPTATVTQAGIAGSSCNVPSGLQTSNIGQTSARFQWNAVSGATSYSLQYRVAPSGPWVNTNPATVTGTSITVTGLSLGVTYNWRIQTNCSNGFTSAWSSGITFTTIAPPTCNTPTDLQTSNITQTSVVVSWTAVPGAVSYTLQTRIAPSGVWVNTNPATFTATSIQINGFDPNTLYEWRVRANCTNGGTSSWADGVPFFTLPLTCNAPASLFNTNITQNTVFLSWTAVSGAASYVVQFNNGGNWVDLGGPPITSTSVSIFGLFANFTYEWRVLTNCTNGVQSQPSNSRTFSTTSTPVCYGGNLWPAFDLDPQLSWQFVDQMYGGDFSLVNVSYGTTYTFSFCAGNGGSILFDGEIYLLTGDGSTVIAYNNNSCGTAPKLTWQAGFTGQVRVLLSKYLCSAQATDSRMAYKVGAGFSNEDLEDRDASTEIRAFVLVENTQVAENLAMNAPTRPGNMEMKVYPNPALGMFKLEFEHKLEAAAGFSAFIYDLLGNVVWEKKGQAQLGLNTWEINPDNWPAGIYMLRLLREDGVQETEKVYISRH